MTLQRFRFPTAPNANPCARSLNGNISDVKTTQIGPMPTEKKATFAQTNRITNATPIDSSLNNDRTIAKPNKQNVIPMVLTYSNGFLPTLSMTKITTIIKAVFEIPTTTVAAKSRDLS
ncbi:hypothetical protein L6452_15707 [Arctium lappa]|uniref:Uncharacterized protein n=1 Tax=Arctium lappa TaxID=4217 RepID=A0ACB9CPS9_ARCLA|nr:hypothetical protein L6452_15707 [Arctium lappa]